MSPVIIFSVSSSPVMAGDFNQASIIFLGYHNFYVARFPTALVACLKQSQMSRSFSKSCETKSRITLPLLLSRMTASNFTWDTFFDLCLYVIPI